MNAVITKLAQMQEERKLSMLTLSQLRKSTFSQPWITEIYK